MSFTEKITFAKELFKEFYQGEFDIFNSALKHYYTGVELAFYHQDDTLYYAKFDSKTKKKF